MTRKPAPKSKKITNSRNKKSKSWKADVKSRRKAKKYKTLIARYVTVFSLFLVSFVFLFGYLTFRKLTSPFVSAYSSSSYDIRGEDIYVIAYYQIDDLDSEFIKLNDVRLSFYDTKDGKITDFVVSPDLELDVPGKFSVEPVSKIFSLGMSVSHNNIEESISLLNFTFSKLLGYNIDKYVLVTSELKDEFENFYFKSSPDLIFNFDSLSKVSNSLNTNLNFSEFYYVYNFRRSLSLDSYLAHNIDGGAAVNEERINNAIKDITFDSEVAFEKKSVAILNGTEQAGIASFGSRIVHNLGGRVVGVDNASRKYDKSVLIVDTPNSHTVRRLQRYFKDVIVVEKDATNQVYDSEFIRADIVLIIGLDIAERL